MQQIIPQNVKIVVQYIHTEFSEDIQLYNLKVQHNNNTLA